MRKFILIVIALIISFALLFYIKPITFSYLTGIARVLEKSHNYDLKINSNQFTNRIYKSTKSFDNKSNHNFLILYLKDLEVNSKFKIIIVNLDDKIVGYPCTSTSCYDLLFGNLIQSEMGSFYVALENTSKGPGFNTDLKIENEKIDFFIPAKKGKKIHIQLSKK
ncbi:hypothetical protein HNP37_002987 [Flavobacterium nitrogenifigens]|uniref:Uncharacterized protein n=2 Tax=Flavobacterium TaxID=237 RepID=A0A7W7IYL2_9FLAO|nr:MULTISPECIES: hypothetical protein [Flavobacterium]MBB4802912.1 hypothetical protein [Flavobacterium nitrogenifigens]MBB6387870.1 hypothetical protein [Flavobacterium notoginsengisoli]